MRSQDDVKPAFGQVWQYNGSTPIMLVRRGTNLNMGEWIAVWMDRDRAIANMDMPWCGLYDDPEQRIPDWELIDEGVE